MSDIKTTRPAPTAPRPIRKKPTDTVLIRKANDLVEARYKFDIWETRLFIKMLSMIRHDDSDFHEYKIYINELVKDYGLENSKDTHRRVRDGARKLLTKIIKVVVKDEGQLVELETPIVGAVKKTIEESDGSYIKLGFYPDMKPFLLELKERYLVYDFRNVRHLPSPYYVRMYELLKQYEKIGERRFEVDDLKGILGLTHEYKLYGHFKSKILDKAQAKLAEHSDIRFEYEERKKGRAVASLIFKIFRNRPAGAPQNEAGELDFSVKASRPAFKKMANTPVSAEPLFDLFFEKLADWWGVEAEAFAKRLEGKTELDVSRAIAFTKERVRAGKAANPAGVFLDALTKGHRTAEQIRADKIADQKRKEAERKALFQTLVAEYERLADAYSASVNDEVRLLVAGQEGLTESVIESIKTAQKLAGNRQIEDFSIEDFRRDPMLRGMVITAIIARFPERFERAGEEFLSKIDDVKRRTLALEPNYRFG